VKNKSYVKTSKLDVVNAVL